MVPHGIVVSPSTPLRVVANVMGPDSQRANAAGGNGIVALRDSRVEQTKPAPEKRSLERAEAKGAGESSKHVESFLGRCAFHHTNKLTASNKMPGDFFRRL
jgi:hypothetical protein